MSDKRTDEKPWESEPTPNGFRFRMQAAPPWIDIQVQQIKCHAPKDAQAMWWVHSTLRVWVSSYAELEQVIGRYCDGYDTALRAHASSFLKRWFDSLELVEPNDPPQPPPDQHLN